MNLHSRLHLIAIASVAAIASLGCHGTKVATNTIDAAPTRSADDSDASASDSDIDAGPPTAADAGHEHGYIDTHMHLTSRLGPESLYDTAQTLVRMMDAQGVETAILMELEGSPYTDVLQVSQHFPGRFLVSGGGSTLNDLIQNSEPTEVPQELREQFSTAALQALQDGVRGFGEMFSLHLCMSPSHNYQEAPADHDLFKLLLDIAAEHDVPIDLHMEAITEARSTPDNLLRACASNPATLPATVPALERLLAHNRGGKVIWQHVGWDNLGELTTDLLEGLLERHENLYLSLRVEERGMQVSSAIQCRIESSTRVVSSSRIGPASSHGFPIASCSGATSSFFPTHRCFNHPSRSMRPGLSWGNSPKMSPNGWAAPTRLDSLGFEVLGRRAPWHLGRP